MLRLVTALFYVVPTVSLLGTFTGTAEHGTTLLAAQAAPSGPVAADPARYSVLNENDIACRRGPLAGVSPGRRDVRRRIQPPRAATRWRMRVRTTRRA